MVSFVPLSSSPAPSPQQRRRRSGLLAYYVHQGGALSQLASRPSPALRRPLLVAAAILAWLCFVLVQDSSALLRTPSREAAPKHEGPVGTEALPRSALIVPNLTTFRLPNGQCVQRAVALPELSCSLPFCSAACGKTGRPPGRTTPPPSASLDHPKAQAARTHPGS